MPRLSNDKRNQAVGMLNAGISATVVSRHFGCTRKTIEHLRRRFRFTGNLADLPRSCRPRTTSATDDRYIILQHLCNRCLTAAATGRHMVFIHRLRNRIRQNVQSIQAYHLYFDQILTRPHPTAGRDWYHRHLHFRHAHWDLTLFSDECRFNLSHADAREFIAVRESVNTDVCVIERWFGGGSVFVWGWIMGDSLNLY